MFCQQDDDIKMLNKSLENVAKFRQDHNYIPEKVKGTLNSDHSWYRSVQKVYTCSRYTVQMCQKNLGT